MILSRRCRKSSYILILCVFTFATLPSKGVTIYQYDLSVGVKLIKEKEWIKAEKVLKESFSKKRISITAYYLAAVSFMLKNVDETAIYSELAINLPPELRSGEMIRAKKYNRWAILKRSSNVRKTQFELTTSRGSSMKDLAKMQALEFEEKEVLRLASELSGVLALREPISLLDVVGE